MIDKMINNIISEVKEYFYKHIEEKGIEIDLLDVNVEIMKILNKYKEKEENARDFVIFVEKGEHNIDKQLTKASTTLANEYKRALKLEYVKNPMAYALYETWKIFDRKGCKDGEKI